MPSFLHLIKSKNICLLNINVLDQIETLSQVGTKKISKGGWTFQELFEPRRNHVLKFGSQSH